MIKILENYRLRSLLSFKTDTIAKYFCEVFNLEEIKEALEFARKNQLKKFFLGAGSNVLFIEDFEGIVIKISLKGISLKDFDQDYVLVTGQAGENWNDFVSFCINNNYGGLENLSLIPGNVGSSPVQNIGAYGVEIRDCFYNLTALNIENFKLYTFDCEKCKFGYRESFFKNEGKNKFIILDVTFKLKKKNHNLNIDYGNIKKYIKDINLVTISDISKIVTNIRQEKLPDPEKQPNVGSFFKNPIVDKVVYKNLLSKYPQMPYYNAGEDKYKIPAAWLIEISGLKGYRQADIGIHEKQALVIINYGHSKGIDIYNFSEKIIEKVFSKFNIKIEREVNIISNE